MDTVISLSGGADSATLLGMLISNSKKVFPVFFQYGSKHNDLEYESAQAIAKFYGLECLVINVSSMFEVIQTSALLKNNKTEIPTGEYSREIMSATVVPGRNLVFSSILASVAEDRGIREIALGVHAGDHYLYPDCTPDFVSSVNKVIVVSTAGKVRVTCPFIHTTKEGIIKYGIRIGVPYELTRSCYTDLTVSCGKCGTCIERLNAFKQIGVPDPIKYKE